MAEPQGVPEPDPAAPLVPAPANADNVRFRCPSCGAQQRWDPDVDALLCDYCGSKTPVPRGEGTITEHALADAGAAARGLGVDARVARCSSCGAAVAYDERATSAECVFCGSPQVLVQEENRNALRPESLVPLDVGRETVERSFRSWIGGLWFRPNALKALREFKALGVYVPFWTFDAQVHSDWSADAGHYYYVQVPHMTMVGGKMRMTMRTERRVRWEPAWGARDDHYDDVLVHASRGLPPELSAQLGGFDLKKLVPYRPEYLAGWRAEEYAVDLAQGWQAGQARIVASQESRCSGDVPGDTQRNLRVANRISDVRWKHVLLPIWTLGYQHAGKHYHVLIHGQTGRVVGKAPYSWVKILLFVLGILAGLGVAALVLAVAGALS